MLARHTTAPLLRWLPQYAQVPGQNVRQCSEPRCCLQHGQLEPSPDDDGTIAPFLFFCLFLTAYHRCHGDPTGNPHSSPLPSPPAEHRPGRRVPRHQSRARLGKGLRPFRCPTEYSLIRSSITDGKIVNPQRQIAATLFGWIDLSSFDLSTRGNCFFSIYIALFRITHLLKPPVSSTTCQDEQCDTYDDVGRRPAISLSGGSLWTTKSRSSYFCWRTPKWTCTTKYAASRDHARLLAQVTNKLPAASQCRNDDGLLPWEVLSAKLEEKRTIRVQDTLTIDVSDQFVGFSASDMECLCILSGVEYTDITNLSAEQREDGDATIGRMLRLKYGCTCGKCLDGFLSPRMLFCLCVQADEAFNYMDDTGSIRSNGKWQIEWSLAFYFLLCIGYSRVCTSEDHPGGLEGPAERPLQPAPLQDQLRRQGA